MIDSGEEHLLFSKSIFWAQCSQGAVRRLLIPEAFFHTSVDHKDDRIERSSSALQSLDSAIDGLQLCIILPLNATKAADFPS